MSVDPGAIGGIVVALITVVVVGISVLLTLLIVVASVVLPFWLISKVSRQQAARRQLLMETGVAAPATVVSASETGMYVNERPMVRINLDVRPPGRAAFQASVDRVISVLDVPRLQPGSQLEVRFEEANPKNLIITSF